MKRKLMTLTVVMILTTGSALAQTTRDYHSEARNIIYHVFPASTADAAFRVAECESVHFTDFWNDSPRSHAKGVFQEMPGNNGRRIYWQGHGSIVVDWSRISSTAPDWYAVQVALYQSAGGTNWGEWVCKPW